MKKVFALKLITVFLSLLLTNSAMAAIISYDVDSARLTGFGGWSHTYNGSITSNGDGTYDYTGGSGTMNDGLIGTSIGDTQLFYTSDNSSITVFLDEYVFLSDLYLYSFADTSNAIPGNISSFDLTVNGLTVNFATIALSPNNLYGPAHEYLDFTGTSISGLLTNQFTLSNFSTSYYTSYFSISEIVYNGSPSQQAPVPEPSTVLLFGVGLAGLVGLKRRGKKK